MSGWSKYVEKVKIYKLVPEVMVWRHPFDRIFSHIQSLFSVFTQRRWILCVCFYRYLFFKLNFVRIPFWTYYESKSKSCTHSTCMPFEKRRGEGGSSTRDLSNLSANALPLSYFSLRIMGTCEIKKNVSRS